MTRNPVTAYEESRTQEAIVAHLRRVLPKRFRVWSVPNGAHTGARNAIRLKREGMTPGVPDIEVARQDGWTARLEVKSAKGKLSEAQIELLDWFAGEQAPVAVVRSVADAEAVLLAWGVPLKGRVQ